MSLLSPPALSALTPDNGLGGARMPKGFEVPGSSDGSNPLYDRNLSVADRLAGGHRYLEQYCQNLKVKIDAIVDGASKEEALRDLISVLKFAVAIRDDGEALVRKIDLPITVQALMGANMVGGDAKIFAGRDIGVVPPLPDDIVDILKSRCELSNDGSDVARTHRLVLIPASIDGVPTSINSLRKFSAEYGKGREPAFHDQDWYDREEFANRALARSKWVLMYGPMAPNTTSKTESEQLEAIKCYKQHETIGALEAVATLVFGYLEHNRREFSDFWCRTEDRASSGARVGVGSFRSDGLFVDDNVVQGRHSAFGRAVCRKFT